MNAADIGPLVSSLTFYPLLDVREEPDHIYLTLGHLGAPAMRYTLALDRAQLRDAIDPRAFIAEHVAIATADLDMVEPPSGPAPMWG